jgi:hypothetical protein
VASPALFILVALNVALQVCDGVFTYVGWEQHGELNPILRAAFHRWGAGPTLLVAKVGAVALVLALARTPRRRLALLGLGITFTAYTALSFVPWATRLLG